MRINYLKKLQPNKNFLRIIVNQSETEFIGQTNNLLISLENKKDLGEFLIIKY